MDHFKSVAVCSDHDRHERVAASLAEHLKLPFNKSCSQTDSISCLLAVTDNGAADYQLELRFPGENLAPMLVDFQDRKLQYRQKFGGGRNQAIARALGLKHGVKPRIVDATAGLGRDAFIMASLDCEVTMLERHPVIHALLQDGLRRLALSNSENHHIAQHLTLQQADSRQWLQSTPQPIDIIYLDPMYPHRTKSALVKKEMRVLRNLVGDDLDVPALLEAALQVARQRVVVKRPKTAPTLTRHVPSHSIDEKKTRFDVYLTHLQSAPAAQAKP